MYLPHPKPMTTINMVGRSPFLPNLSAISFFFFLFVISLRSAHTINDKGFTVELFHSSSLYLPSSNNTFTTTFDRKNDATQRSLSHYPYFSRSAMLTTNNNRRRIRPAVALSSSPGAFIVKLGIGTPPVELMAVLDTGSDFIWSQCKPCEDCYQQTTPIFDSEHSSTYQTVGLDSHFCQSLHEVMKDYNDNSRFCNYSIHYQDGTYSKGVVSTETLTFDAITGSQRLGISGVGFGCGHTNRRKSVAEIGGIIGLGRGPLSLISQLGSDVGHRFSYCLDMQSTSKLKFGNDARFLGPETIQSTPLILKRSSQWRSLYFLKLQDISVNGRMLHIPTDSMSSTSDDGGLCIDSGSTLTSMAPDIYFILESALKDVMGSLEQTASPGGDFRLCFVDDEQREVEWPNVIFHFDGGANWVLPTANSFTLVKNRAGDTVLCSAFVPSDLEGFSIFGNIAQESFHVEYDLMENVLRFARTDCSRL